MKPACRLGHGSAIPCSAIILAALLAVTAAAAGLRVSFSAKVIGITDGDTITVLDQHTQVTVRLAEIDTPEPERGQP